MNKAVYCVLLNVFLMYGFFLLTQAHGDIVHVCYAPGTPSERMIAHLTPPSSQHEERFDAGASWTSTASNSAPIERGERIKLLWSIVPDGTPIAAGFTGDSNDNSDVRAFLTNIFGDFQTVKDRIQESFDRWGQLVGITYEYVEESTSCAISPTAATNCPGEVGVRGDIRIGGHTIDGNSNILGYNYFPTNGDMVLDTDDNFYANNFNNVQFDNVISHEHGHGLGFEHVCPVSQTKLMEPTVSGNFDGPQLDDIRGGQLLYGDSYENNNDFETATSLGMISGPVNNSRILPIENDQPVSIETNGNPDNDYYSFSIEENARVIINLFNFGSIYAMSPQGEEDTCGTVCPCSNVDSTTQLDLNMQLFTESNEQLLATANNEDTRSGSSETIEVNLISGTYYLRIYPGSGGSDKEQLYDVTITIESGFVTTTANGFPGPLDDDGAASSIHPFYKF